MIFRTITYETIGANKSIGLFGKSLSELKDAFSSIKANGIINSLFNTSTIDTEVVHKYNVEIEKATSNYASMAEKQQIMKSAMESTNSSTAQLIESTKGTIVETEALTAAQQSSTIAAKAYAVALKTVSVAGNMIVMLAISKAISLTYKAIDNYIHRLENAREELNKTTSEIESIDTEFEKVRDTMDEILAKDTIDLTDENELKQLREEVELLEAKRKLLDAQEYEDQQETNKLITEQYNKYFKTAIVTKPDGSIVEEDALSYVKGLYAQAKEYSSSTVPL